MIIFITGGSGFLGQALIAELLNTPGKVAKIYLHTRSPLPESVTAEHRIKPLRGELGAIETFKQELLDSDYVFHLAANASFSATRAEAEADNLAPTQKMVQILKTGRKLKNLIFISSIGAADRAAKDRCHAPLNEKCIANPRSDYGRSKLQAEEVIRSSGLPFTIFRPGWIYGANMRANSHLNKFVTMISQGSKVAHFNFPGFVSLVHVNDLAKALVRTIDNNNIIGKTYFAVTEALSLGEILATIGQKVEGPRPFQIPVFGGAWLIRRIHCKLPIALSNLFIGYLWADERPFIGEFSLTNFTPFWSGVDDIVKSNARTGGKFLITGANSGIGLALAKKLAKLNRPMILVDKKTDALKEFTGPHKVIYADFSSPTAVDEIAKQVSSERLAALVNNAGVGFKRSLDEASPEEIRLMIQVNDMAPVLLTKALLRQLKRDNTAIINISSSTAYNPLPGMSIYAASKAFISSWSEALSYELRATNPVTTFSPSGTHTGFQKAAGVAVLNQGKGLQTPEFVADQILSAFNGQKRHVILGGATKILLLVSRFLPRTLNVKMWGILFAKMR